MEIIKHQEGADAASVAFDAYAAAKARGFDILIIDTAGRLQNKGHLMEELRKMVRVLRKHDEALPHECLLVIDGNTGQNAIQQGQGFNGIVKLDGLVVTKLDGTSKGGSIIPICREFGIPVSWVGVGEDLEDLIRFDREEYVQGLFLRGRGGRGADPRSHRACPRANRPRIIIWVFEPPSGWHRPSSSEGPDGVSGMASRRALDGSRMPRPVTVL